MEHNYGILASIDWNSRKWRDLPIPEDLSTSNYGYVKEYGYTHTCLNFGHELYPTDEKGYYYGLLPQLWSRMPDAAKARYVEVVFIKSQYWKDKQNYIVGLYAFPEFQQCIRKSPDKKFQSNFELNVKSHPEDIILLENFVKLTMHSDQKKFLPDGKEMGKQGYNYLTKDNVYKILDEMTCLNPADTKLKKIKLKLLTSIGRLK